MNKPKTIRDHVDFLSSSFYENFELYTDRHKIAPEQKMELIEVLVSVFLAEHLARADHFFRCGTRAPNPDQLMEELVDQIKARVEVMKVKAIQQLEDRCVNERGRKK